MSHTENHRLYYSIDGKLIDVTHLVAKRVGHPFYSALLGIPNHFYVVSDVTPSTFKVEDLKFVSGRKWYESQVTCQEMFPRALALNANLGFVDGQYILANQDKLPVSLRDKCIALPGTIIFSAFECDGTQYFTYLYYSDSEEKWTTAFCHNTGGWWYYKNGKELIDHGVLACLP